MSAGLVSIVAEVLKDCAKADTGQTGSPAHYAHQARAVLAALETAGTVEWGSEHVAQAGERAIDFLQWRDEETARRKAAQYGGRVVSRLTFPWTAVEA